MEVMGICYGDIKWTVIGQCPKNNLEDKRAECIREFTIIENKERQNSAMG